MIVIGTQYEAQTLVGTYWNGKKITSIGGFSPTQERFDFADNTSAWVPLKTIRKILALRAN